MQALEIQSK